MVFTSPLFLFLFFPLFFLTYYGLRGRWRITWILLGSWIFYGLWRWDFLALLIFVSFFNWLAGLFLQPNSNQEHSVQTGRSENSKTLHTESPTPIELVSSESNSQVMFLTPYKPLLLALVVVLNLGILGYFKYANFGVEAFNSLLTMIGFRSLSLSWVILPVGISFYIFQAMSYSIDVYRGDAPVAKSFISLAAYIALFPQLIAGPIVRYKDLATQLLEPHISWGRINRGLYRFLFGLSKKVLLADTLGLAVDGIFTLPTMVATDSWFGILAYTLQLYLDFSAYSDMAIGLGLMLGFRFRENFRQPYLASSITEFWQRWHISLSTWLRDYLYIPLGGNRKGTGRTKIHLFLVMVLGGFWHGASWNFLLWGAWHGILLLLERDKPEIYLEPLGENKKQDWKALILRVRMFLAIILGWVLFRAETLEKALFFIGSMFGATGLLGSGGGFFSNPVEILVQPFTLVIFVFSILFTLYEPGILLFLRLKKPRWFHWILIGSLTVLSIMKLMADSYSPFLYFQF